MIVFMGKIVNYTGKRYGRLLIIAFDKIENKRAYWAARCVCGGNKILRSNDFTRGKTKSCGCGRNGALNINSHGTNNGRYRHGMWGTSTYKTWQAMKQRCLNPNNIDWPSYGGRGITVCERWLDFKNFIADMGERPEGLTIERINNDGNYELSNCKWATYKEQNNNQRNSLKYSKAKGGECQRRRRSPCIPYRATSW